MAERGSPRGTLWTDSATRRACHVASALSVLAACAHGASDPTTDAPFRFEVTNALIAPVTVSIDGAPLAILSSGKQTLITARPDAQWLTWTSAKPAGPDGAEIPDQIGEVRVAVAGINGALQIRNVVDDQVYITASLFNTTPARVTIGVFDGVTVWCAGVLPGVSAQGVRGFVQIGYYRLSAATEIRAYRDSAHCTGVYTAWPSAAIKAFEPNSGLVVLTLDAAP
jgi:hypothetical protein